MPRVCGVAGYRFLTTWLLDCPRQQTWDVMADCLAWPQWWRGVESVDELESGDARRMGSAYRVAWRAPLLPYVVRFDFHVDDVREPALMAGSASGELAGSGTFRLFEEGGLTALIFDWEVQTTRAWMNVVAPMARPLFGAGHDRLMARGGADLAGRLGATLLASG